MGNPNLKVGNDWRGTLNVAFSVLRRTAFLIFAQEARQPENGHYAKYESDIGGWQPAQIRLDEGDTAGILPIASGGTGVASLSGVAFTPAPSSSAGTGTYTVSNATYIQIGKLVNCFIYFKWSQATAAHAQVSFSLPVTAKSNTVGQFWVAVYTEAASGTLLSMGFIVIPSGGTTATIRRDLASTVTWPIAAGVTNYAICNFTYEGN